MSRLRCDLLDVSDGLESPGVVVTLHFGLAAMAILVPQAGGLLPRGYDSNDAKAQSTLVTLAQELGMLVLPEALLGRGLQRRFASSISPRRWVKAARPTARR